MNAATAIEIAAARLSAAAYPGSAELCLDDARKNLARGDERAAIGRAADSLRYSVGVFHADYAAVAEAHNAMRQKRASRGLEHADYLMARAEARMGC